MPEDAPWADPVVVPDDIRALQGDIDAYHREMRAARRRHRWARFTGSAVLRRWSFPLGILTGAVALAVAVAVLLAVDGAPTRLSRQLPEPLATATAAPAGALGGLLPDARLATTDGDTVLARALRPALVVLLPPHCSCTALLDQLAGQAAELQLRLVVVGPTAPDAEIAALPGRLHRGTVVAAYDASAALATAYAAQGVTALVLARDGVVTDIARNVTSTTRLELPLETALLAVPSS